jgi:hypothetical protein
VLIIFSAVKVDTEPGGGSQLPRVGDGASAGGEREGCLQGEREGRQGYALDDLSISRESRRSGETGGRYNFSLQYSHSAESSTRLRFERSQMATLGGHMHGARHGQQTTASDMILPEPALRYWPLSGHSSSLLVPPRHMLVPPALRATCR